MVVLVKSYELGNPFKIKYRKHYCYKCGMELVVVKDVKIVKHNSEEAKYYDFTTVSMRVCGDGKFIHNVLFCDNCREKTEYMTQIGMEDVDIAINDVVKHFKKKKRSISITKYFENNDGKLLPKIKNIEDIKNLCLIIEEPGKETIVYKSAICRLGWYERPYYFKISKSEIIKFIKNS